MSTKTTTINLLAGVKIATNGLTDEVDLEELLKNCPNLEIHFKGDTFSGWISLRSKIIRLGIEFRESIE